MSPCLMYMHSHPSFSVLAIRTYRGAGGFKSRPRAVLYVQDGLIDLLDARCLASGVPWPSHTVG